MAKSVFLSNKEKEMVMTIKRGADKAKIKSLVKKLTKERSGKGIDAYKYCGSIQLKESPKDIQKSLRSEWD